MVRSSSMTSSSSASGGNAPTAYINKLATYLKDYMTTMEQMPKEVQLISSQIIELDKNSDQMLDELEDITQAPAFIGGSVPAELRRRVKCLLIDIQSISDEQHRFMSDVGENIQRHIHRNESQRKEADMQIRLLANKAQTGGSNKQSQQDGFELHSSASRDLDSSVGGLITTTQQSGSSSAAGTSKKKRLRESGMGGPSNAKHAKRSNKDSSPGPSVTSTPVSGGNSGGSSLSSMRRVTGGHRKSGGIVTNIKRESTSSPSVNSVSGGAVKKKKKSKNIAGAVTTRERNPDRHVADSKIHHQSGGGSANPTSGAGGVSASMSSSKTKSNRRRTEKESAVMGDQGQSVTSLSTVGSTARRRGEGGAGVNANAETRSEEDVRYCICKGNSLGAMVGCDGPKCEIEWFHFECVGLEEAPKGNWYCPQCEQNSSRPARRAKGKSGNSGGTGR